MLVPPEPLQEPFRLLQLLCESAHTRGLRGICSVTSEDEDLPPRVGREDVLDVVRARICGTNEDVRDESLSDYQLRRDGLVLAGADCRGLVVHAYAACEETESLERPVLRSVSIQTKVLDEGRRRTL